MTSFFIRTDNKFVRVPFEDIYYVEALKNYIRIVTQKESYLVLITMKQMERELPARAFCRVHRSFIVSLEKILFFDNESMQVGDKEIPVSPHFKSFLFQKINIVQQETSTEAAALNDNILIS